MEHIKYIAFFDVLGFSDLVKNNSHEHLMDLYSKVFINMASVGMARGGISIAEQGGHKTWAPEWDKININSLFVSDSLILWTDTDKEKEFVDLITASKSLLYHSFVSGFPLRGGIVEGSVTTLKSLKMGPRDNTLNSVVGKGLVDAYQIQDTQSWSGCMVSDATLQNVRIKIDNSRRSNPDVIEIDYLYRKSILDKYPVPKKTSATEVETVVDWITDTPAMNFDVDKLKLYFRSHNKSTTTQRIQDIIENTLRYVSSKQSPKNSGKS